MNKIVYCIFCLPLLFGQCTEEYDVKLDDTYTRLVVDAVLTDEAKAHYVKLTKTSSYFSNEAAPAVSGAMVSISDGSNTVYFNESPSGSGIYLSDSSFQGIPGTLYTLNIVLKEAIQNNKTFSASCFLKALIHPIDSIGFKYHDRWDAWGITLYAQEPSSTGDFYMFKLYRNGKAIKERLSDVFISDDRLFNGKYTNGIEVGYFQEEYPDQYLYPGDTVVLEMDIITKEYYDFVYALQTLTFGSTPMFGGTPANVKGNISNDALGFFAAYSIDRAMAVYK
jgi:hypothetical protein